MLNKIDFKGQDIKLEILLSDKAEEIANRIERDKIITTTQYRRFYDWILRLEERAKGMPEKDFKREILPMVKFMKSKVKYSETRKLSKPDFTELMFKCIDAVQDKEDLKNFKLFMEAILGFLPRK